MTASDPITYSAVICNQADSVEGDFCDVAVVEQDIYYKLDSNTGAEIEHRVPADRLAMDTTQLTTARIDAEDRDELAMQEAKTVLAENGWSLTGQWQDTDNALYANVERA